MKLKKNGKVFTSKFVGTGPLSFEKKRNLPGRGLTNVEKHWSTGICDVVTIHKTTTFRTQEHGNFKSY